MAWDSDRRGPKVHVLVSCAVPPTWRAALNHSVFRDFMLWRSSTVLICFADNTPFAAASHGGVWTNFLNRNEMKYGVELVAREIVELKVRFHIDIMTPYIFFS